MKYRTLALTALLMLSSSPSQATYVDPMCAKAARDYAAMQGPQGSDEYNQALSDSIEHCEREYSHPDRSYQKWLDNFCSGGGNCYVVY